MLIVEDEEEGRKQTKHEEASSSYRGLLLYLPMALLKNMYKKNIFHYPGPQYMLYNCVSAKHQLTGQQLLSNRVHALYAEGIPHWQDDRADVVSCDGTKKIQKQVTALNRCATRLPRQKTRHLTFQWQNIHNNQLVIHLQPGPFPFSCVKLSNINVKKLESWVKKTRKSENDLGWRLHQKTIEHTHECHL